MSAAHLAIEPADLLARPRRPAAVEIASLWLWWGCATWKRREMWMWGPKRLVSEAATRK